MGKGASYFNFLQSDRDRLSLVNPDPYRQVTLGVHLAQDYDPLLRHQAHPDAVDDHFHHIRHNSLILKQRRSVIILTRPKPGRNSLEKRLNVKMTGYLSLLFFKTESIIPIPPIEL